jgi:cubilin
VIYNEISSGCGGQIHLTDDAPDFVFSSPNYPQIPPPFTECEWVFTVPANEAVQLDFQLTFQLLHGSSYVHGLLRNLML